MKDIHKVELLLTKETLLKENENLLENARYFENIKSWV
jgi:hypothetical protein